MACLHKNEGQIPCTDPSQDPMTPQTAKEYWLQCIHQWYPELYTQTYFLPPLHFNRVPYSLATWVGKSVLVTSEALGVAGQTPPPPKTGKSRSSKGKRPKQHKCMTNTSSSQLGIPTTPSPVYDSQVRDDNALQRTLHCIRSIADDSSPPEVMMVICQLQFGKYLHKPTYEAAITFLPRPSTLPEEYRKLNYQQGDIDLLIIHKNYGLLTFEIKSIGANFGELNMSDNEKNDSLINKVKEAIDQLNKSEIVLKHLISDLPEVNVTKILGLPNIKSRQLLKAVSNNPVAKDLCECLGVPRVDDALSRCLLSERMPTIHNPWDVKPTVLTELKEWWHHLFNASEAREAMPTVVYEEIVARFCGPATTVNIHCICAPRLELKTQGAGVYEAGERMAQLVLFPEQLDLLNESPQRVFLTGPPGTGKTVVLILQGLSWMQREENVHVLSTSPESRAVSFVIEHQLNETKAALSKGHSPVRGLVFCLHHDFHKDAELKSAVRHLTRVASVQGQLKIIADEAGPSYSNSNFTQFCDMIIKEVPAVGLWAAALQHEVRPPCLLEVKLTTPLRSPPSVIREIMKADEIQEGYVYNYTASAVPFPTDGPGVKRITHRNGQNGHVEVWPRDCAECGRQIARVLKDLNIRLTITGACSTPQLLRFRDVIVLCNYQRDERVNSSGLVTSTAIGLVQGLRSCDVPVCVVDNSHEEDVRDIALALNDEVVVTDWDVVRGLERKVVVVVTDYRPSIVNGMLYRLHAVSRCSAQLVWIDW